MKITDDTPLCFIHLPKTGGRSLINYLDRQFPRDQICSAETPGDFRRLSSREMVGYRLYRGHMDVEFWEDRPQKPIFITLLRRPLDRIVSLYCFWRSHSYAHIDRNWGGFVAARAAKRLSLTDFVHHEDDRCFSYLNNGQARQLAGGLFSSRFRDDDQLLEAVLSRLASFHAVGTTENLDQFVVTLSRSFGWACAAAALRINSNVDLKCMEDYEAKPEDIDQAVVERICKLNAVDTAIHRWASDQSGDSSSPRRVITSIHTRRYEEWYFFSLLERTFCVGERRIDAIHYRDWRQTGGTGSNSVPFRTIARLQRQRSFSCGIGFGFLEKTADSGRIEGYLCAQNASTLLWDAKPCEGMNAVDLKISERSIVDRLWEQMASDLSGCVIAARDWEYVCWRYLRYRKHIYDVRVVRLESDEPAGIIVMNWVGATSILCDLIGPKSSWPSLVRCARTLAYGYGIPTTRVLVSDYFAGALQADAPARCGPPYYRAMVTPGDTYERAVGKNRPWFLTGGDLPD